MKRITEPGALASFASGRQESPLKTVEFLNSKKHFCQMLPGQLICAKVTCLQEKLTKNMDKTSIAKLEKLDNIETAIDFM